MFLRILAGEPKAVHISTLFKGILSDQFIGKTFKLLMNGLPVAQQCIVGDIDMGILGEATFPNDHYDSMILNWGERVYGASGELGRSFPVDVVYVNTNFKVMDSFSFDCNGVVSQRPLPDSYFTLFFPVGHIEKYGIKYNQQLVFEEP